MAVVRKLSSTTSLTASNDNYYLRLVKTAGAITTHFIYDVNGQLIAEANGATGAPTREFIWLPDGMPLAQVEPSSVFWYVLSDHHGTPQKLTDSTKAIVWDRVQQPFGETQTITGTATSSIRFPGQYADAEDGNYYNYSRDYDPTTGRYLQTDTIGQNGGLNLYKYAESNPLRYTDRRGLSIFDYFRRCDTPSPRPPDCKEEREEARRYCMELYNMPPESRPPGVWGGSFDRCWRGQVSYLCGGNKP